MDVTELARENAVRLAQSLNMGQTAVAIQDGCSTDQAVSVAFSEHMTLHSHCPCCRGSSTKALTISRLIVSVMKGSNELSER